MSRGIKNIFRGTRKVIKERGLLKAGQPRARRASHDEKITMWVGEYRCKLRVEDWMRGH